jgi:anaerobic selenocysteine-containing dehydrogenase
MRLEKAAMSETKKIYTSCTLDCPDGCGIIAHVADGKVVKLEGHSNHEFTRGYLCAKTYRFPRTLYSDERQLHPLRREGDRIDGAWKRIGWDEALDLIAEKTKGFVTETSPLSIMHYQRTGSWGATKKLGHRFWNLLGGVTTTSGSLCSGAARAGQKLDFGERLGHDPSDMINSKLVLLWGRNPLATNLHIVPLLKEVRENGGRVVLIDPVKSESATICDKHVQPRVATDAAFALALAKIIIVEGLEDTEFVRNHTSGYEQFQTLLSGYSLDELSLECGLSVEELQVCARDYAKTKPGSILLGWGLNKYKNSAEIFRCVDALAALCGQIGIAGAGVSHGFNTQRHFDKSVEAGDSVRFHRAIPEPLLGRGLLEAQDPPVRMMFVNGGNPVNQSPNSNLVAKAFRALDFVVVVDSFLTDTADYAHVFLPTTMFLEEEDVLVSWGHNIIGGVNPVVAPRGETRSDMWIFQQLALRLGFGSEMAGTPRDWLKRILAPLEGHGVPVDQVMEQPIRCPTAPLVPFADRVFGTRSGKFEFIERIDIERRSHPDFPLTFVTNFSKKWLLSQMLETDHPKVASVRIGVVAAKEAGIANGTTARMTSSVGHLDVEVIIDPRVGEGMVIMPVGTWVKRGGGANVVTEDIMSNFGQMAAYGETRVRLEPISASLVGPSTSARDQRLPGASSNDAITNFSDSTI